ncbi:MAG: hypothetical protein CPDRYMAC_5328 [uncultured Paraburkholderia sp.]|nr:MAG: hypothetical protein CPDRYDRY_5237 [uncultured Paraburkholderia sp.]CAH2940518.1 MAG: hypothetical protein CPDRYMAC_5328 [uncultured Paraburkholderia sp.]
MPNEMCDLRGCWIFAPGMGIYLQGVHPNSKRLRIGRLPDITTPCPRVDSQWSKRLPLWMRYRAKRFTDCGITRFSRDRSRSLRISANVISRFGEIRIDHHFPEMRVRRDTSIPPIEPTTYTVPPIAAALIERSTRRLRPRTTSMHLSERVQEALQLIRSGEEKARSLTATPTGFAASESAGGFRATLDRAAPAGVSRVLPVAGSRSHIH